MSTDVKSMHMGQITSFFIPTVTLVGQNCSTQIPDRLKSLGGKKPLIVTDQWMYHSRLYAAASFVTTRASWPWAS